MAVVEVVSSGEDAAIAEGDAAEEAVVGAEVAGPAWRAVVGVVGQQARGIGEFIGSDDNAAVGVGGRSAAEPADGAGPDDLSGPIGIMSGVEGVDVDGVELAVGAIGEIGDEDAVCRDFAVAEIGGYERAGVDDRAAEGGLPGDGAVGEADGEERGVAAEDGGLVARVDGGRRKAIEDVGGEGGGPAAVAGECIEGDQARVDLDRAVEAAGGDDHEAVGDDRGAATDEFLVERERSVPKRLIEFPRAAGLRGRAGGVGGEHGPIGRDAGGRAGLGNRALQRERYAKRR